MKKVISLAVGAVAMVALSGCNFTGGEPGLHEGEGSAFIYTTDLKNRGYKISGWDTIANKSVDLCFDGYDNFLYGRGSEYFEGHYSISGARDIVFEDTTDDGSYRLYTNGEITEGDTYDFGATLPNNNIKVESISYSSSMSSCKGYGKNLRKFSTIKLASQI